MMRTAQSSVSPMPEPNLPSTPSRRRTSGLSDFIMSSTFFWVTPSSSALTIAMGPAHDVFPVVIALAHGGSERLFGNDFRQHYIGAGIGQPQPLAVEAGGVRRIGIAAAAVVSLYRLISSLKGDRLERHVIGAEIVGEIELGRGTLLHADRSAVELQRRIHLQRLAHHKTL